MHGGTYIRTATFAESVAQDESFPGPTLSSGVGHDDCCAQHLEARRDVKLQERLRPIAVTSRDRQYTGGGVSSSGITVLEVWLAFRLVGPSRQSLWL